jgi:hypothetical protein
MPDIKIEKEKLNAMLAQVGAELAEMVRAEQAALAKSAIDDAPSEHSEGSSGPTEPDGTVEDEISASPSDEGSHADGEESSPYREESSPYREESSPYREESSPYHEESSPYHEESSPAEHVKDPAEEAGGAPPTMEQLQAEYAKLDPDSLKTHYLACKAALMELMGADQGQEASAPGAGGPPSAQPGPEQSGAPMALSEMKGKRMNADGNGGKMKAGKLGKSEEQLKIERLEEQIREQHDALLRLTEVVAKAAKPIRKSIKSLSDLRFIDRTETTEAPEMKMSKAEVTAKLREKVREGKLSKSDQALVTKYTLGTVDVSKIKHLLVDAK